MSSDGTQDKAIDGQPPERALDAALSSYPRTAAGADFRARLRQQFVSGEIDAELEGDPSKDVVTFETAASQSGAVIDLEPALEALQPTAARLAFKRELREQFVGAVEGEGAAPQRHVAKTSRRPRASRPRRDSGGSHVPSGARRHRRQTWFMGAGALALAAALVVSLVLRTPARAGWQVLSMASVPAATDFQVDGVAFISGQDLAFANRITAGSEVLRLQFHDQLVVDLEPGSSLDISGTRGAGDIVLAMAGERGGYRVATLDGFDGSQRRLLFRTPDAEVEVRGTVFGIDRYQDDKPGVSGTCVCCCKGEVLVRAVDSAAEASVLAGKSSYVLASVGEINPMDIPDAHRGPLDEMLAQLY